MSEEPIDVPSEAVPESQVPARIESGHISPLDMPAEQFRAGLERRGENRKSLMDWVWKALVKGTDYGPIHIIGKKECSAGRYCKNPSHFSKAVLFKPGAEKICGMLGVTVTYPTLCDYEQAAIGGVNIKNVILRCELISASGQVIAHGVGGRAVEKDYGDLNKTLKMCEKSAHIDATLRMAGLSEIFTQDLEDMVPKEDAPEPAKAEHQQRKAATTPQVAKPSGKEATQKYKNRLLERLDSDKAIAATELFRKWKWIGSDQKLEDLPLDKVPTTKEAFDSIMAEIQAFMDGGSGNEEFWDVVIPVPYKGQKRADYMKNPDTIRSLYEAGKDGDDDARKRLFGFANNWEPTGWEKRDGTKMPPSEADNAARAALDQFLEWEKEKGN